MAIDSGIALVTSVSPLFGQWLLFVLMGVWLLLMRLSAVSTEQLECLLGEAVQRGLWKAGLVIKEAAAIQQVDPEQFRQALKHERYRHISLTRLVRLPLRFWMHFLPELTALVVWHNTVENVHDAAAALGLVRSTVLPAPHGAVAKADLTPQASGTCSGRS